MLDTTLRTPATPEAVALRELYLSRFGKRFYRDLNPHNVRRRFDETERGLLSMALVDRPDLTIVQLASFVQDRDGSWLSGFTITRLRQFEATARHARCDLIERGVDPDCLVNRAVVQMSHRLRIHQHTYLC